MAFPAISGPALQISVFLSESVAVLAEFWGRPNGLGAILLVGERTNVPPIHAGGVAARWQMRQLKSIRHSPDKILV
jgi:hypothetical protein